MRATRCFLTNCWLAYKAMLPTNGRIHAILLERLGYPVMDLTLMMFVAYFMVGPERIKHVLIGNIVYLSAWGGIFSLAVMMARKKASGTLKLVLAAPINLSLSIAQKLVLPTLDVLATITLGLGLFFVFAPGDYARANLLTVALGVLGTAVTMTALGLAVGSLGYWLRDLNLVVNSLVTGMLLVCGVNFPLNLLPRWLQWVGNSLPLTHGVAVVRQGMNGATPAQALSSLLALAGVGAIFLVLSVTVVQVVGHLARRGATFEYT